MKTGGVSVAKQPNTEKLVVTVDYGSIVEEMVRAGSYNYANPDITSQNFTTTRGGEWQGEVILVHFGRVIGSDDALAELEKMGLRTGGLHELLAVGVQHPDKQREFPIVALGSGWQRPDGDRGVPFLGSWDGLRELYLRWFGVDWYEHCRFLAFCK